MNVTTTHNKRMRERLGPTERSVKPSSRRVLVGVGEEVEGLSGMDRIGVAKDLFMQATRMATPFEQE